MLLVLLHYSILVLHLMNDKDRMTLIVRIAHQLYSSSSMIFHPCCLSNIKQELMFASIANAKWHAPLERSLYTLNFTRIIGVEKEQ